MTSKSNNVEILQSKNKTFRLKFSIIAISILLFLSLFIFYSNRESFFFLNQDSDSINPYMSYVEGDISVSSGQEKTLYGITYANNSGTIVSTPATTTGIWYPDSHKDKNLKSLTIEIQIDNETNPMSIQANMVASKYYSGEYIFNTSNPNMIIFKDGWKPNMTWTYSTTYKNYNKSFEDGENITTLVPAKEFSNWLPILSLPAFKSNYFKKELYLDPTVSSCGFLNSEGAYTLTNSINSTGTCITFNSSNVQLDCQGFNIDYGEDGTTDYGITLTAFQNISISNCNIYNRNESGSNSYGIRLIGSIVNLTISNNTIETNGTTGSTGNTGIDLRTGANNNMIFDKNTIKTLGAGSGHGISIAALRNFTISNSIIDTNYAGSNHGITLTGTSYNGTISDNIIHTNGSQASYGIYFSASTIEDNLILNNSVYSTNIVFNGYAVNVIGNANIISNNTIVNDGSSGTAYAISVIGGNNNITNNNITANGSNADIGISISTANGNNNLIKDNIITAIGKIAGTNRGISIATGDNNIIINNTINVSSPGNTNTGIAITTSDNNYIANNTIIVFNAGTTASGISIASPPASGNVIVGNEFNVTTGTTNGKGIDFRASNNSIRDNVFNVKGSSLVSGIDFITSFDNNISYNNFTISGGGVYSRGLSFSFAAKSGRNMFNYNVFNVNGSNNNIGINLTTFGSVFANNTIITNGTQGMNIGIHIGNLLASNNTISGNKIYTDGGLGTNDGIMIMNNANNNTFNSNIISTSSRSTSAYGINMMDVNNTEFIDNILNNTNFWINSSMNTFNNFTNTTFLTSFGSISILPSVAVNGVWNIMRDELNISNNLSYLNSTYLTIFNTSAEITLTQLTLGNATPQYALDDATFTNCTAGSDPSCSVISYNNLTGIFVFNTTHFTQYRAIEGGTGQGIDATPTIVFNNQVPADITSTNINNYLNITYNITSLGTLSLPSILLYHKTNDTASDQDYIVNGTASFNYTHIHAYNSNISSTFDWDIAESHIYPMTANIVPSEVDNIAHSSELLTNSNQWLKTEILNVSNMTAVSVLFTMNNASTNANTLIYIYCNSSYSTGNPEANANCFTFWQQLPSPLFNSTNNQSSHKEIPFVINTTSGNVAGSNVKVTPTSFFLLQGSAQGGGRYVYYVNQTTRTSAVQKTTNKGNSWADQTYTTDIFLTQFHNNETFYKFVCANSTTNEMSCSSELKDNFELGGLPPSSPNVNSPNQTYNAGNINIIYTPATSPNGYAISYYNISLLNADDTFNKTIVTNNSINLNYTWDSTSTPDGTYIIQVRAYDTFNQTSDGFSANFTIDNTMPLIQFVAPTSTSGTKLTGKNIGINVTASDTLGLVNITINLYNSTNSLINSSNSSLSPLFINFSVNAEGTFYFNATAIDLASNRNYTETRNVTIDLTNPSITINTPTSAIKNNKTQLVNITATDANIDTIWFFNGSANVTYTTPVYVVWNEGSNTMTAYVNDTFGNLNETSVTFIVDTTPPSLTISSPTQGNSYSGTSVLLDTSASDANGIYATWFSLTNSTGGYVFTNLTYNSPYSITLATTGTYNLTAVYANDTAGNLNTSSSVGFTFIYVAPTPSSTTREIDNSFSPYWDCSIYGMNHQVQGGCI